MISIEADDTGYRRAIFNQPFKTVTVEKGLSYDVLPSLLRRKGIARRPWVIWLDYDQAIQEGSVQDLRLLIEQAPTNSFLIATFPANGGPLGRPAHRPDRLRALFGSVVPDGLSSDDCKDEQLERTISGLLSDFMLSVAASAGRPGGFEPAFRMAYRDGTPMVTVGGILPKKGLVSAVRQLTRGRLWPGFVEEPIAAPNLTLREAAALQAQLPRVKRLTRRGIQRLGMDLEDAQLRSFERYYRYYPSFAQLVN